uniref:Transcription factor JunB n=1 Tax=Laticauda laticaudata TaxID=8630 RepID=A0A8C5SNU8_LATLA
MQRREAIKISRQDSALISLSSLGADFNAKPRFIREEGRGKVRKTEPGDAAPSLRPPLLSREAVLQPLLKLPAAADLEQLLIQAGSPGLAGPSSPTGGGPSAVTQEQEGFADGFVKALADLHKQNQLLGVSPAPLSPTQHPGGPCCPTSRQDPPAVYTTLGNFNPTSPSAGGAFFTPQAVARLQAPGSTGRALDEPQTVPEAPSPPPPSSLSPLDAESQERLKAERKRLRNRIAASKCRRRKLERIARLEEKVKALKGQNAELAATASLLRAQVTQLQGRVRSHLSSGCHINSTKQMQKSSEGKRKVPSFSN